MQLVGCSEPDPCGGKLQVPARAFRRPHGAGRIGDPGGMRRLRVHRLWRVAHTVRRAPCDHAGARGAAAPVSPIGVGVRVGVAPAGPEAGPPPFIFFAMRGPRFAFLFLQAGCSLPSPGSAKLDPTRLNFLGAKLCLREGPCWSGPQDILGCCTDASLFTPELSFLFPHFWSRLCIYCKGAYCY